MNSEPLACRDAMHFVVPVRCIPLRIGQNPAALDDLMKETASKMALCPFVIAPPNTLPEKFLVLVLGLLDCASQAL